MTVILIRTAAWFSLLAICVTTVGPVGMRPATPLPAHVERFAAFLVVGALFGAGYPKSLLLMAAVVILSAGVLELAQHLVPNRHGRFADFIAKAAGGGLGVFAARMIARSLSLD